MSNKNHPYQIIDPSPWPIVAALGTLLLGIGGALAMHGYNHGVVAFGLLVVVVCAAAWWRDV
ncbi:MAG: cytochrome c oxidase subunit 3, partial [Alphaproteobacteria bacterium]|nr:cytochrome c oxidase subunit 3 [Alphaproteobacteria bacterium]